MSIITLIFTAVPVYRAVGIPQNIEESPFLIFIPRVLEVRDMTPRIDELEHIN